MKPQLLDLLICPMEGTPLELRAWEYTPTQVITGVLVNHSRRIFYPIHRSVPRLLVFPTAVTKDFAKIHAERLSRELPGYSLPNEPPMPGEETVLRTFSDEWVKYDWNDEAYWSTTPAVLYNAMDFMLDLNRRPLAGKHVLEVGIGIGGIADNIARNQDCELVGIDLGYAVDAASKNFGSNPRLHIVQASAFRPPFKPETFDFVYSQGVLHHSFSTKAAFDKVSRLPKPGGRLYVWVYNPDVEKRSLKRRGLMLLERALRPVLSRLPSKLQTVALSPIVLLYLWHQKRRVKTSDKYVAYGWREAIHAARDRFTPKYAHRHTRQEVSQWFTQAGYTNLAAPHDRPRPDAVPEEFLLATAVEGIRSALFQFILLPPVAAMLNSIEFVD
jgi:SAM-dependent methyltransferase/uncharacterized protein YbaR (Trm112 family)